MRAQDLTMAELVELDPEHGEIRFAGKRALLFDAVAMGLLRRQLVDMFGLTVARALLTRFGFAHGYRMAEAMSTAFPWDNLDEQRRAGGVIHTLAGHITLMQGGDDPLSPSGATLLESYEAEQHLLHLGLADAPVCWTLCGIASGYLSRTDDARVFVLEDRCIGKGDAACHVRAQTAEQWGAAIDEHLPFFQGEALDQTLHQKLATELRRAERRLRERKRALSRARVEVDEVDGIVARSQAMQAVLDLARRAARVDATVLITGESGVGKERIARLLHDESARASGPFLAVNCGAISDALLESELFGHVRGAFTGATHDRAGLFEAASRGTLFLDEVGEIPVAMQPKLLRALQTGEIRRVGESHPRKVDVRVLAATNREVPEEVRAGRFRKDLYYRLKVIELPVPPLRDRREDILPLARLMLVDASRRMKRAVASLTPKAADQLVRYSFPGNVRELENAMERAVALARGERIDLSDLPEDIRRTLAPPAAASGRVKPLAEVEREYILSALALNEGNQTRTAAELGIAPVTLYRKLKSYAERAPKSHE
jgi:transcriptional regulator with PAS, ATPase and Fis domain